MPVSRFVAIVFLLLVAFFGWTSSDASVSRETVRVAIVKGGESVRIDGDGVLVTLDAADAYGGSFPLTVRRTGGGLSAGGKGCTKVVASASGTVRINGKSYRGLVEIVPGDRGMLAVNELPLEDYLVGLINCEISSQWPMEAVKAQAVIARTYALYQKNTRRAASYHLEATVLDQVYDGCEIEDSRAARGVLETEGEVLTWNGAIIQAFYHSSCGGHTEAAENVWGFPLPYAVGVDCRYCVLTPSVRWEQTISLKRLEAALKAAGLPASGLKGVRAGTRNVSGRLTDVVLETFRGSQSVPAVKFRQAVGYGVIRSTAFTVRDDGGEAAFRGMGFGHGVGLCQWGAKIRAADGFSYREILAYYYPGTLVERRSRYWP
jgi:stage II sporulation protein D